MRTVVQQDDENSLLDLLLVAAENIRLLVIGPFLIAALAFGLMYLKSQTFVSQAILLFPEPTNSPKRARIPTPAQTITIMTSPILLDLVVETMGLGKEVPLDIARKDLADRVKVTVSKVGLLHIDVVGKTLQEAQATANALIDSWLKSTVPGEDERQFLEARHAAAQKNLANANAKLERLKVGVVVQQGPRASGNEGVLDCLGELQDHYLTELLTTAQELKGLPRNVVVQPPTLPGAAVPQKKVLTAVLSALVAAFVLLLFVSVRASWRNSAADPR